MIAADLHDVIPNKPNVLESEFSARLDIILRSPESVEWSIVVLLTVRMEDFEEGSQNHLPAIVDDSGGSHRDHDHGKKELTRSSDCFDADRAFPSTGTSSDLHIRM